MRVSIAPLLLTLAVMGCEPEDPAEAEMNTLDAGSAGAGDGDDHAVPEVPPEQPTLEGDVLLRNRVALNMPVLLRPLADDVSLDCAEVERDPTASLPESMFAEGEQITLLPHEMVVVWPHEPAERPCYAVWVETEGLGSRILFWHDGTPPILSYPENSCCDVGQGVVELIPVNDGWSLGLLGNEWLVYETSR